MSEIRYLIGVDGGGTKCRARLRTPAGDLLGEGLAGTGNIRSGMARAWTEIMTAIDMALGQAGLDRSAFARASVGLGLAGIVDEKSGVATIAHGPRFAAAKAVSDAEVACIGAFDGGDGAILISGTGCAGHVSAGGVHTAISGWGFDVGDRASAAGLGRAAVMRALDAVDGLQESSALTAALVHSLGGERAAIVDWTGVARPRDYGFLARVVMEHADAGDPVALDLVRECAVWLERIIRRLVDLGAPRVCLVGGMAHRIEPWLGPGTRRLLQPALHDAVEGAVMLARSNIEVDA